MKRTLCLLTANLLLALELHAADPSSPLATPRQDWPQWRGPNRDGVADKSPSLVDALPAAGPALLWEYALPPTIPKRPYYGSPAVADGRVYLRLTWPSGADAKTMTDLLVCVTLTDGKEVWKLEAPGGGAKYGAPNTPCIAGGKVYCVGSQGAVLCLDAATGKTLWDVAGGINASPVVSGDTLVVLYWETGLKVYRMTPAAATEIGAAALESDDNLSCTPARTCVVTTWPNIEPYEQYQPAAGRSR